MSMNISSNFFNSMLGTSSSNSSSGLMGLLSDYNSIRNGSYLKLAKHYYSNDSAKKATQKQFSKSNIETKTEDTATKTASEDAWKDLKTLKDEKLYQSADTDKIQKNVKSFVSNYNSVMESAQNSDKSGVLKDASRLASQTGNYTSALAKIGITMKSDNTLAFDEEAFASADMSDVKKLFAGDFSFGSNTQSRMLQLASDASANSSSVFYNQYGAVAGASVGSFYDSLF
ncbi:MAG TPA: hypothetical protein DIW55_06645 [Lachnospiraceae bacterium]|jgi:hypothetical protein|nr:hypothetical protein [Lachnospiraceae bacterium]